jgi:hypothetical protein
MRAAIASSGQRLGLWLDPVEERKRMEGKKDTTDNYQSLRTRDLSRFMLDHCGSTIVDVRHAGRVVTSIDVTIRPAELLLDYSTNDGHKIVDSIPLEYSPCHFGGRRPWFICPSCRKRKTVLYCARYFRCATCLNLTYSSLHERKSERPLNRLLRRRWKLGGDRALSEPFPEKPKGMRWEKYFKLLEDEISSLGPALDLCHAAMSRSVKLAIRRSDERSKREAKTPENPKPTGTAKSINKEDLAAIALMLRIQVEKQNQVRS